MLGIVQSWLRLANMRQAEPGAFRKTGTFVRTMSHSALTDGRNKISSENTKEYRRILVQAEQSLRLWPQESFSDEDSEPKRSSAKNATWGVNWN